MALSIAFVLPSNIVFALKGYDYSSGWHWNISAGQTISYYIFQGGSPDIPDNSEITQIQGAFYMWTLAFGSYVYFAYGGLTATHASLPNNIADGINVVDFIDLTPYSYVVSVQIYVYGSIVMEAETIFNERYAFSTNHAAGTYDVANAATHGAGMWLSLLELADSDDSEQTMYVNILPEETKKVTLEWGDEAGASYIYPNRYQVGQGPLGYETQGADVAVGNVNGIEPIDMVTVWMDNPSGENTIKYRFGWNIDWNSGEASSWSSTKTMSGWVGTDAAGVGVALVNLDATSNLDLVVLWVYDPGGANTIYYKIGWNLNTAGDPASWSSLKSMPSTDVGDSASGAGVAFVNIDANSRPEIIVAWVDNPMFDNVIYYKIGWNVNTLGNPTSWSNKFSKNGWVGSDTSGLGITFANIDGVSPIDMILFWADEPFGANHGKYQVGYNIASSGSIASWSAVKTFPGDWQWVGDSTQGAGIAVADLNNNGRTEMIFLWVDNPSYDNYAYYRVEWEGRINSHS